MNPLFIIALLSVPFCGYLYRDIILRPNSKASFEFTAQQVRDYHTSTIQGNLEYLKNDFDHSFFDGAKTILDIGCGAGDGAAFIAKQYPQCTVVGSDISQTMIEFATKQYPTSDYSNLSFIVKDGRMIDYHNSIDRIISFNCIHWINDQKVILQSIYDNLCSGGKAFIITTPKASQNDFESSCRAVILSLKWLPYFLTFRSVHSMHSQEEYEKMFIETGFAVDKIEQRNFIIKLKDRAEAEMLLSAVLTPLNHLPEHKKADFLNDLFIAFDTLGMIDADGGVNIRFKQLHMLVSKP